MRKIKMGLAIFMFLVSGCANKKEISKTFTIGVMPAVDSAPIFLANELGYFEELDLKIEIQVYTNAMNRQSALQSGELDGAMTDVIALVNNVGNGFDIKVTTSTDGLFPILYQEGALEKEQVTVGMMEVSVSNYLSDQFLNGYAVKKEYINEIPARLEMVGNGTLDMAVIPEPMASMGALNGLSKTLMVNEDEFSPEVMVFNAKAIKDKSVEIQKFHDAYNKAVHEINKDQRVAKEILINQLGLKPEIINDFDLPHYNEARVPTQSYLNKIIQWNESVLGAKFDLEYSELVDDQFVR